MLVSVDTKVLLRANLMDDDKQSEVSARLLTELADGKSLVVSSYAVLEFVWVLKGKGRSRDEIAESVLDLLDSPGVVVGDRDVLAEAVSDYRAGRCDFGDYMILAQSRAMGAQKMASFDQNLVSETRPACDTPEKVLTTL